MLAAALEPEQRGDAQADQQQPRQPFADAVSGIARYVTDAVGRAVDGAGRGTAGIIRNFIVMGFKTVGVDVNGSSSLREAQQGALQLSHGVLFANGPTGTTHGTASTLSLINSGVFTNVVLGQDPGLRDCFNHLQPDFRPRSLATLAGGQLAPAIPPNDGFFEAVTFIGAVGPGDEDDWTAGWTAYPQQ